MKYIKVEWRHAFANEPIVLYSETDEHRWERRKVYFFRQGPPGYASDTVTTRTVWLGECAVPPIEEIASNPEFEPREISKDEFEHVWCQALHQSPHSYVDGFTIPHLVTEFFEQDCDATARNELLAEISKHPVAKADTFRHFTFNRFNVRFDFRNSEVTVDDELDVGEQGSFTIAAFTAALNRRGRLSAQC